MEGQAYTFGHRSYEYIAVIHMTVQGRSHQVWSGPVEQQWPYSDARTRTAPNNKPCEAHRLGGSGGMPPLPPRKIWIFGLLRLFLMQSWVRVGRPAAKRSHTVGPQQYVETLLRVDLISREFIHDAFRADFTNSHSTFNRTCNDKADSTGVKSNLWYFESKAVYTVPG